MSGACFVVAFGHGTASERLVSPQAVAEALRHLVDTACKAKGQRFARHVYTSVAPGGVMLAFRDDAPDRVIELCQAVAAQLEHQAKTHLALPPVCAAITHGPLRQVDVLGFSSNFEGWPAIAAARVVAKLAPGELALEQSVWEFASLVRHCADAKPVQGKPHDKPFDVRIHQDIRFPTTTLQELSSPATAAPASIAPLPPYVALAQQARERIASWLQDPRVEALRAAIARQGQGQSAEAILVPDQASSLLHVLKLLQDATRDCLQRLEVSQSQHIGPTKTVANAILSCLTALAIDRDGLARAGQVFDPWQNGLQRTLALVSEAGVEVTVASLGNHPARFREFKDNRNPRVVGENAITHDELESGLTYKDRLAGLLRRIWCAVLQVEHAPEPFEDSHLRRLHAILNTRTEDKTHLYYIILPPGDPSSQIDATLIDGLLRALPSLRVFSFSGKDSTGLLCVDEFALWARIEQFLRMVTA